MSQIPFGDEIEFDDISALERVIAHLAWTDPELRRFGLIATPLERMSGNAWRSQIEKRRFYNHDNRHELDQLVHRSYTTATCEPTTSAILVVIEQLVPQQGAAGVLSGRCLTAVIVEGHRSWSFPCKIPVRHLESHPAKNSTQATPWITFAELLPYMAAPRWALDRENGKILDQLEVADCADRVLARVAAPGDGPVSSNCPQLDRSDLDFASELIAITYRQWLDRGSECVRYFGRAAPRIVRSREYLLRRHRTIGDWLRNSWFSAPLAASAHGAKPAAGPGDAQDPKPPVHVPLPAKGVGPAVGNPEPQRGLFAMALAVRSVLADRLVRRSGAARTEVSLALAKSELIRGILTLENERLCLDVISR